MTSTGASQELWCRGCDSRGLRPADDIVAELILPINIIVVGQSTLLLRLLNLLGCVCVYSALFLYEDEEGLIQNRVEDWWIALRNRRNDALSFSAAFMQSVAKLTGRGFDRVFGNHLLSLQMIGVSVCFSIASALLFVEVSNLYMRASPSASPPGGWLIWCLFFVALGLVPSMSPGRWILRLWGWSLLVSVSRIPLFLAYILYRSGLRMMGFQLLSITGLLLGSSLFCDIFYITLNRWMLRRASKSEQLAGILTIILGTIFLALLLVYLPLEVGAKVAGKSLLIGGSVMLSFVLNSVDIVICLAVLIVAGLMLIHRLLWPILERPLYAFQRYGVIRRKTLLWTAGIGLITIPTHSSAALFKILLESLKHT